MLRVLCQQCCMWCVSDHSFNFAASHQDLYQQYPLAISVCADTSLLCGSALAITSDVGHHCPAEQSGDVLMCTSDIWH